MALPQGWALTFVFTNQTSGIAFSGVREARGICPLCGFATSFDSRNFQYDLGATRTTVYMILACNSADCRKTLYVETSITNALGNVRTGAQDPFFVHPSRAVEPAHRSIPPDISEDWLEAQRCFAGGNPKATAMMLRRVLYGILLGKGCRLRPLKDGVQELINGQRLPAVFDDWLPAIQDDGHDAAHPDRALNVSAENVGETMEYTAELLRYLYIEPYEFQRRKTRNATVTASTASAITPTP